jgi:hypothetical protein
MCEDRRLSIFIVSDSESVRFDLNDDGSISASCADSEHFFHTIMSLVNTPKQIELLTKFFKELSNADVH